MSDLRHTRCRLRAMEREDVELLYMWENDPQVWRVSGAVAPVSRERLLQFIEEQTYDLYATRQMRLVVEVEGVAVGSVDIFDFDPQHLRFGVGVLIYALEDRCKGYAREAIEQVKEYALQTLNLKQIWATVAEDNVASRALFEGCGFSLCGQRRAWLNRGGEFVDELEYQCLLR